MSRPSIVMPPLGRPVDELWHVLLDLSATLTVPWTLIGGQMVLLHAIEHGHVPPQVSQDGDVIADIRADDAAIGSVVAALEALKFDLEGISADHLAHRYVRPADPAPVKVDVLAPDGLGPRTNLTTTKPGRTVEVPGGTQALNRTELIEIIHEGRTGAVPRPSLLGAVICKAAACKLPGNPERHLRDLALLCALIEDPFAMREELTKKDRRRIEQVRELSSEAHGAWQLVPAEIRERGQIAYDILLVTTTAMPPH
jgi:hypothetical protein